MSDLNQKEIQEARSWICECVNSGCYSDVDPDEADEVVEELSDSQVARFVENEYDGGVKAFKASGR